MKTVYRIYLEVEKVTENPKKRRERFSYTDVTFDATDFAWSYEAGSMTEVRQAAQAMHGFAQELYPGNGIDFDTE